MLREIARTVRGADGTGEVVIDWEPERATIGARLEGGMDMEQQQALVADERNELRKNILLLVRYCAFIGPSSNAEIVLHVLAEVDRLKARYRDLDPGRTGGSSGSDGS